MFIKQDEEVEDLIEVLLNDFVDDAAMMLLVKVMTRPLKKKCSFPALPINGILFRELQQ
ncbi:MAG: hypothetical protein R2783_03330 [Gelidibacter sp.]